MKRKRLFFDIETSPNIGFFWGAGYQIDVPYDNIIDERKIICICWKWEGQKRVYSLNWGNSQDDKTMLKEFIKVMNEADEIIAHNGDRFDIKWLRTRCLLHGIDMMPDYTSIDTLKMAKGRFRFNSNRLDYIGQFLNLGGKKDHTGFDLWKDVVLKRRKGALKEMIQYCKRDVILLEEIFNKINNYIPAKTNAGRYRHNCPECGSENVYINKYRTTAQGYKKVTFQCKDCGKYHTMARSVFEKSLNA